MHVRGGLAHTFNTGNCRPLLFAKRCIKVRKEPTKQRLTAELPRVGSIVDAATPLILVLSM